MVKVLTPLSWGVVTLRMTVIFFTILVYYRSRIYRLKSIGRSNRVLPIFGTTVEKEV